MGKGREREAAADTHTQSEPHTQHTNKKGEMPAAMKMRTARPARSANRAATTTRGRTSRAVSANSVRDLLVPPAPVGRGHQEADCVHAPQGTYALPRVRLRRALVRKGAARIRTGLLLQPLLDDVEAPDVRLHRR